MVLGKKNGKEGMNVLLGGVKIEQSKTKKLFGIYIYEFKSHLLKRTSPQENIIPIPKLQLFKNAFLPLLTYYRTARYFCKASDRRKMEKKSCAIQRKEQPITKVSKKDNNNPATLLHC